MQRMPCQEAGNTLKQERGHLEEESNARNKNWLTLAEEQSLNRHRKYRSGGLEVLV